MTVVIGLGARLDVRMRTRLENGILRNGQQPGSAVNSFFDHSKFEAMKSLSCNSKTAQVLALILPRN